MFRALFSGSLAVLGAITATARAADPTDDEVWQLVRDATALYESLEAVDYDIRVDSPEIAAFVTAKSGGLVGAPEMRLTHRNFQNDFVVAFPDLPEIFRARAEQQVEKTAKDMEAIKILRDVGWTMFGALLRTIETSSSFDIIEWNENSALVEFNDLNEPLSGKIIQAIRFRFVRKSAAISEMKLWLGADRLLEFDVDYSSTENFPNTEVPQMNRVIIHQVGFKGPPVLTLVAAEAKFTRTSGAIADDTSMSWRAQLKRAGFTRFQIDATRVLTHITLNKNIHEFIDQSINCKITAIIYIFFISPKHGSIQLAQKHKNIKHTNKIKLIIIEKIIINYSTDLFKADLIICF